MKHVETSDGKFMPFNFQESQRMLSIPSSAFGSLRKELIDTLGLQRATGFLLRYGWNSGASDGKKMKDREWESDLDLLLAGPKLHELNNHVEVEPEVCNVDLEKGTLHFEGNWKNSYEAKEHLKMFGRSDHPVCHTLVGYASGYMSIIMGEKVIVKETQCEAMGDSHCHWVGKTIEEWKDEIDIQKEISYYETDRIIDELDETYEMLRIERDNLSRAYAVHYKLVREVLRERDMKSIANVLYQSMKMPVIIEDRLLNILAIGGLQNSKAQAYSEELKKWVDKQEHKKSLKWKEIKQTLFLEISENHKRVLTPIYLGSHVYGYCSFLYNDATLKEVDKMVLEQAALACSLLLLNEKTRVNTEQRMKGSFLEDILNKRLTMPEIMKRAHYIDFKLEPTYFVISIYRRLHEPSPNDEIEKDDQFITNLLSFLNNNFVNALIDQRSEHVIILLTEDSILKTYKNKEQFCRNLLDYCSEISSGLLKMGVSTNSPSIEQAAGLFDESMAAVKVANSNQNLVYFDSLGIVGILLQANNISTIEKYAYQVLGNLIEEDKNKNMELTKTLYYYLENGSNVHKTARAMNLSISGLRYRLARINEILQKEINSPFIRHEIYLALQSLIVLGELELE